MLNFPEEMTVGNGNAKYKLIDDAYVFHTWNCATEDWQNEYEEYRTKAIEREQKVRRQLQDEINKHRS